MAVDTHVFRVAARIGLTKKCKNPLSAELQLSSNIPTELMHKAHSLILTEGTSARQELPFAASAD